MEKKKWKLYLFIHSQLNMCISFSFQMSVEMFDYLDNILDLQAASKYPFSPFLRISNCLNLSSIWFSGYVPFKLDDERWTMQIITTDTVHTRRIKIVRLLCKNPLQIACVFTPRHLNGTQRQILETIQGFENILSKHECFAVFQGFNYCSATARCKYFSRIKKVMYFYL